MIKIAYFSDLLCIWAYVHDIRMRTLLQEFGSQVTLSYHFLSLFAATHDKIDKGWKDRGGWRGYGEHVVEVASRFEHIRVHPEVWQAVRPHSSASTHQFIKALQLLQAQGQIDAEPQPDLDGRTLVEAAIWALRLAFFRDLRDISQRTVQQDIASDLDLPWPLIQALLESGEALAGLFLDLQLQQDFLVKGSPTLVFNEGRQTLYGNVGYRVIEANLTELLNTPSEQASWC
ncbi:MAG: DsbA family protein [Candidatus Sericytochromatia bacterium]